MRFSYLKLHVLSLIGLFVWILVTLHTEGNPLKSRAPQWLMTPDEANNPNFVGDVKVNKETSSNVSPSDEISKATKSAHTTLAAILLFAVLGVGATVLFVVVCSKMSSRESYKPIGRPVK